MSYGPTKVFSVSIASGASSAQSQDLGKAYSRVYAEIPTMSTAAAFDIWQSVDGTTYYPAFERVNTSSVQYATLTVASGVGANGGRAPLDVQGPYVQFRASAVVSGGVAIKLICVD